MMTLPSPNPIPNNVLINYEYTDTNTTVQARSTLTNTVYTQVNVSDLLGNKIVDNNFANVGTKLVYTVTLTNQGNVSANNIIFFDTLPSTVSFVPNSLIINGVTSPNSPEPPGVLIGDIIPNGISTITWNVLVNSIPYTGLINNSATMKYEYLVEPASTPVSTTSNTSVATTRVNQARIDMVKSADKINAIVNDTITYTIILKNTGTTIANAVTLTDTIPTSTTFITDSVIVNSSPQIGVIPNPPTGISVGSIQPNEVSTVTFEVKVDTIPTSNAVINDSTTTFLYNTTPTIVASSSGNSNQTSTYINFGPKLTIMKYSNTLTYCEGDVISYFLVVNNCGDISANDVIVLDALSEYLEFVKGSVSVNGTTLDLANIVNGVNIGTIAPCENVIVQFNAMIKLGKFIKQISNTAQILYDSKLIDSNIYTVKVERALVMLDQKIVPHKAKVNDIVTYTIDVKNIGSVDAEHVFVLETLFPNLEYCKDSLTLNGHIIHRKDMSQGLYIGMLKPNEVAVIKFKVKVAPREDKCEQYDVTNTLIAKYNYRASNITAYGTRVIGPLYSTLKIEKIEKKVYKNPFLS